jgi:pimeloyl-ACP methyl ester carboxylesterase
VPVSGRGPAGPGARGIVLVLHGGRSASTAPTAPWQLTVLRMVPLARSVRCAATAAGRAAVEVDRPRFRLRGWNGAEASPVGDLEGWLDAIAARPVPGPVALIGHSMGARAALRAAGHPAVVAVAGLAPWLPPDEPVGQLAGRRVLLAHGDRDRVTSPVRTWAYAERAREVTDVTAVAVDGGEHAMLRRARFWHHLAADFTLAALADASSA